MERNERAITFALDMFGLVPVVGEVAYIVNGAIYFVEGNRLDATISFGAAIAAWGWVSTGGKRIRTTTKVCTKPITSIAGRVAYRAVKNSKGAVRFIKLSIGEFSHNALKTFIAVKPANITFTKLSRTLLEQSAHRIKPLPRHFGKSVRAFRIYADILFRAAQNSCSTPNCTH